MARMSVKKLRCFAVEMFDLVMPFPKRLDASHVASKERFRVGR